MTRIIEITDPTDVRVDEYRDMNDQAIRRRMEGDEYFLSEGWVSIGHLIETRHRFRSVLLSPSRVKRFSPYLDDPALANVPVYVADHPVMRQLVGFEMPRAVVMSMDRRPLIKLEQLASQASRLVVLEALNDNENVGAIARTARAFGVDGLVLSPTCTDPYYRRTVRVSMGEILHLPVSRVSGPDWPSALSVLRDYGFTTWAMSPATTGVPIWSVPVPDRLAIMLGAEGPGLTDEAIAAADATVAIPISADVDSLNVGHAAAIALAAISRDTEAG